LRGEFLAGRRALLCTGRGRLRNVLDLGDCLRQLLDAARLLLASTFISSTRVFCPRLSPWASRFAPSATATSIAEGQPKSIAPSAAANVQGIGDGEKEIQSGQGNARLATGRAMEKTVETV
jgi:hypothetical protein